MDPLNVLDNSSFIHHIHPASAHLLIDHLGVTRLPRDKLTNTPICKNEKPVYQRNENGPYMYFTA